MGRRDIVIALRGTCTVLEWAENFRAGLVPATEAVDAAASAVSASDAKVECGFRNLYKTAGDGSPSLSEMVVTEVRRLLKNSHCPFRANAKRSILRLLKNQGGNVKQLYISKAMDMRARLDAVRALRTTTDRANAKRSILRLLKNQGGNVKQLYISKAMDMRARLDAGGAVDMPGSPLSRLVAPSTVLECVH
ncbi:Phospholipase A1-Ibeta2, chloroplastic [Triticum urartu]|uniref:Phospholipase A1-Ibeta2, chloroplastic n=1 Tax=Triticum urartu TaxID=4572 RepID=M7ZFK2_TRIUA|nr:Phospholipase A1-Ibeta2, chloroplastic [Triticum urartu]